MVQNWSFEIQHQFATDLIFSIGYIGNHATRLHANLLQFNSVNPKYKPLRTQIRAETLGSPAAQATLASPVVTVPRCFPPLPAPTRPIHLHLSPPPPHLT